MAIRHFEDSSGIEWQVWSTVPATGGVAGAFLQGWLTFDSGKQRRRLAPIPVDWQHATDTQLRVYCEHATVVAITPRDGVKTIDTDGGRRA